MAFLRRFGALTSLLLCLLPRLSSAQARFDLPGPKIDIRVTRAGITLPIAAVPNLQPNDQIWLHPDLPASQSVHYLLIAAFLRGTTNPPPDSWFIRIETWQKRVREEGVFITVPPEAQQAVLFLAPETGGDFPPLRSAVKGRPGIFVRASQDLNEAGFEQARIETYLTEMKRVTPGNETDLQHHSDLLARTLSLKPNPDCFKRPLDLQYNCLTQTGTQTLLDDGHAQSIAATLSNGPSSDLINQASYTAIAGAGTYSAYVGAIVDLVRLTSGLHTAKYQYIPAIAFPGQGAQKEALSLRLNTAPSFNNPKSVIVIGLPAVLPATLPPLRPVDSAHVSCLLDPHMVLPVDGAPLVFTTAFAHNVVLHMTSAKDTPDIPLTPDPYLGGLVIATPGPDRKELPLTPPSTAAENPLSSRSAAAVSASRPAPPATTNTPGQPIFGTIQGMWGFDHFTGPTVALQATPGANWHLVVPSGQQEAVHLIAGQPNHLQLLSSGTACIRSIALEPSNAPVEWTLEKTATAEPSTSTAPPAVSPIALTLNLQHDTPRAVQLAIRQFGQPTPDQLGTRTFSEPPRIAALQLHAGDTTLDITGTNLDQVKSLTLALKDPVTYSPCPGTPSTTQSPSASPCASSSTAATLTLPFGTKPPTLKPGEHLTAAVTLQDGRTLQVESIALPPRPALALLSAHITQPTPSPIQLTAPQDLPLGAQLTFFLKSPTPFPRTEQIEIANLDASLHTTLSVAAGTLILQDAHTVLATFDPLKTFGPSTFGPFHLRAITAEGTSGDWLPLATIVRLPTLTALACPAAPAAGASASNLTPCTLTGTALYLIDSLSLTQDFTNRIPVPEGYVDTSIPIPLPAVAATPTFYLRLRDDPTTTHPVLLPMESRAHTTTTH